MNLASRVLISGKTSRPTPFQVKLTSHPAIPVGISDVSMRLMPTHRMSGQYSRGKVPKVVCSAGVDFADISGSLSQSDHDPIPSAICFLPAQGRAHLFVPREQVALVEEVAPRQLDCLTICNPFPSLILGVVLSTSVAICKNTRSRCRWSDS